MGINLALVGFLMLISPALVAWREGVKDPDDLPRWLMDRKDPWKFLILITSFMVFGLSLMLFGAMWSLFPDMA